MSLADSSFSTLLVWLAAFGLSALCLLAACFELFFAKASRSYWIQWGIRGGVLAVSALIAADVLSRIPALPESLSLLSRTALLALALVTVYGLLFWRNAAAAQVTRLPAGLGIATLGVAMWTSGRFYMVSSPQAETLAEVELPYLEEQLSVTPNLIAYTDLGRAVTLYEYEESVDHKLSASHFPDVFNDFVIVQSQPSGVSNCHGWIFAEGTHIVRGAAVNRILDDNRYEIVSEPQVGDLIVHRDPDGVPSHTGLVKAIGADGFVLIESKWGLLGRYLHEPTQQCYSQDFAYYRSPREGHALRIEEMEIREIPGVTPADPTAPSRIVRSIPSSTPALGNQHPLGAE